MCKLLCAGATTILCLGWAPCNQSSNSRSRSVTVIHDCSRDTDPEAFSFLLCPEPDSPCCRLLRAYVTCPRRHPFPITLAFTVVESITRHQAQARDGNFGDDSTGRSSDSNIGLPNTSSIDNTLVTPGADAANATTTEHVNDAASSMGIVDGSVGLPVDGSTGPEEASC